MSSKRSIFKRLMTVQEAITTIFNVFRYSLVERLLLDETEEVEVFDILGRLVGEDIIAPRSLPWYPRSLVDGCAVKSVDVQGAFEERPVKLKRMGRVKIGTRPDRDVTPGSCVEVDTGAWVPLGADAVVPIEYYNYSENEEVIIERSVPPGANIAMPASDISEGDIVVTKGTPTSPFLAGVLASLGIRKVKVTRKVRVGIFSTGDELIEVGNDIGGPWDPRIYDSNRPYLLNEIRSFGWLPVDLGVLPDNINRIKETIKDAIEEFDVDIIIASGGTSAGIEDYVYRAVNDMGKVLVHGLRLKPGKPTVVGEVNGRLFIGLPGNPRSCINVMNKFVKPLLSILGLYWPKEPILRVKSKLLISASGEKGRRTFLPVALIGHFSDERYYAVPVAKDSYMIGSLAMSNAQIVISEHQAEPLRAGTEVDTDVYRLSDCTFLVTSDTTERILKSSLNVVRKRCRNVNVVISPLSLGNTLKSLRNIYVMFLDEDSNFVDLGKAEILAEYPLNLILMKRHEMSACERISVPASLARFFAKVKGEMSEITSATIAISVPRVSSSKILFEKGYADCALALSEDMCKDLHCKHLGVKKLILAFLRDK